MTHQHDRHAHTHTTLAHPYYHAVERPILTQLREPAPDFAPRPCSGRVLKPLGAGDGVSLIDYFENHMTREVADDDLVEARLAALRADVRVYGAEVRDPDPLAQTLHDRMGHAAPQRRWKWKTPTTRGSGRYKMFSAT